MYENRVLLKETEAKQTLIESIEFFFFSKNVSFVRRDKKKQKQKKRDSTKRTINGGHTV